MALEEYVEKRDFDETPEPPPGPAGPHKKPIFVVQEHHASTLHYDFRLEAGGVLKSWAVPKEPSLDPAVKRLAVRVEDHPVSYAKFEGTIPAGHYGAGVVHIWDHGTFAPAANTTVAEGLDAGRVEFVLHGRKLRGRFTLLRMKGKRGGKEQWLLVKGRDEHARREEGEKPKARPAKAQPAAARVTRTASRHGKVEVTSPDKVMDPRSGATKADVFAYYRTIAPRLLPFLRDRPATLERLPDGLGEGKPHFWQKNTPDSYPDWVPRVELPSEAGKPVKYAVVNDLDTLLYLVNQGTLTFHVWFSRVRNLDRPDFVLFDLDRSGATFADVVAVAAELHRLLDGEGVGSVVKTTGKTGLHVLTPWAGDGGYDESRAWALGVAERVAEALPDTATTEIRKAKRGGRVYIDVLQNARGHHAVPPYVPRAVPGLAASAPVRWREVTPSLDPAKFDLRTLPRRLARLKDDPLGPLLKAVR